MSKRNELLALAERAQKAGADEHGIIGMLIRDNKRMRAAGCKMAEAAIHVVREYDGIHRLSLSVAEWAKAVANEGDRERLAVAETNHAG